MYVPLYHLSMSSLTQTDKWLWPGSLGSKFLEFAYYDRKMLTGVLRILVKELNVESITLEFVLSTSKKYKSWYFHFKVFFLVP